MATSWLSLGQVWRVCSGRRPWERAAHAGAGGGNPALAPVCSAPEGT
ncbi:MAG: hypothetical protein ACK583_00880 [Cyanobacteriota bacterium]